MLDPKALLDKVVASYVAYNSGAAQELSRLLREISPSPQTGETSSSDSKPPIPPSRLPPSIPRR